jgi:hypothetical protein
MFINGHTINKGRIVSEETKKKISVANKGRKFSESWIKNLSISHKNIPSSKKGMILVPLEVQKERRLIYKREWNKRNLEKLREYGKVFRNNNREKINASARERYYKNRDKELARHRKESYNIDDNVYWEIVEKQDGKCFICGDKPLINLSVDHNHLTGKVRGLICNSCNIAIAKANDSPMLLRAMADYLEKFDG